MKTRWLCGTLLLGVALPAFALELPRGKDPSPPAAPDFSREPFVIEVLKSSLRFEADGTGTKTVQTRVLVQTEGALQQLGQLVLDYNSDFERLTFKGRVIKPDGTKAEIPASAIQDMSSPVSRIAPMYSDIRQKHVIVPGLRPGDVLDYELQFEQFAAMAPNQFWAEYNFGRSFITKNEELRIDVPASRFVNVKSRPEFKPDVREVNGRRTYFWKTANLERDDDSGKKKKKGKPGNKPEEPSVQVTTFQGWGEVGDWYANLERDRRAPSDVMRAKVAELTKDQTDGTDKLRAIYRFVAQEFRYVSLSFGTGRYQPHAAAEVFGNQYGDCKDKSTLLAAMAEVAGLHVQSALTSVTRDIDATFPSPLQFNHVISYLRAGNEEIWLDTTTELAPFRMLLAPLRKKDALVVAADGKSVLSKIPADPAVPNSHVTRVEGAINDLGTLDADVRLTYRGDSEVMGRLALRAIPQAQWKDFIQYVASTSGVDGEISGVQISAPNDVQTPLEYRFHITKQNYFNRFEKDPRLALPFGTATLVDPDDFEDGKPIDLGHGRSEYYLKLQLSKQFEARLPLPVELKRDYAQYSSKYALEGLTFIGSRTMDVKVNDLPADRRNDFQAFRGTVLADIDQKIPVKVKGNAGTEGTAGVDTDELLQAASSAYDNLDYRTSVELIERVLKSEPDHKSAYNDLGRAYLELGQLDKAEAALKKAVTLNPFSPFAYTYLGRLYWLERRYKDAEKEFRKQIEIVPLDWWALSNLGEMLVEQKKYAEAEPVLEKAAAVRSDNPRLYVDLGKAQINLKKPEKAQESFDRAIEMAPSPLVWYSVASTLVENNTNLNRAQRYAESAVAMLTAQLRDVRLEHLTQEDLLNVNLLASCWDTVGWAHFRKGETPAALRYLNAAWDLAQDGTVADHIGQVYARSGKRDRAIEYYAFSAAVPGAKPGSRDRLVVLVGEAGAKAKVDEQRQLLGTLRAYDVPGAVGEGMAEFFVALAPGSKTVEARFASGDQKLKSLASSLKSIRFKMDFPDEGDARVFRRGILTCEAATKSAKGSCGFILLKTEDVHSVD